MRLVAVIVARMTSERLPGKPLLDLGGKTAIERHVERVRLVDAVNEIYIATSRGPTNAPLVEEARRLGVQIYAGAEEDVVERFVTIGEMSSADALIRIGSDKPLFCYDLLRSNVETYRGEDYVFMKKGYTVGVTHEILSLKALKEVHNHYRGTAIAQYIREHPHKFRIKPVETPEIYRRPEYRLALDTPDDYALLKSLFHDIAGLHPITTRQVMIYLDDNPQLAAFSRGFQEKNVNLYSWELEDAPVFKVLTNDKGNYIVVDRIGESVPYEEFLRYVSNRARWEEANTDGKDPR